MKLELLLLISPVSINRPNHLKTYNTLLFIFYINFIWNFFLTCLFWTSRAVQTNDIRNPARMRLSPHFIPRHKGTCASSPFVRFITPLCFRIVTEMRRLCSTYTHGMRDNGRVRPLLGTFVCQRGTRGPPKAADDSSVNAW